MAAGIQQGLIIKLVNIYPPDTFIYAYILRFSWSTNF